LEPILKVNAPSVVAEIIDGEAVIMDLASGHYFSTQGVGCDIWRVVEQGAVRSAIVRSLLAIYDAQEQDVTAAVDTFVQDLIGHKLVIEVDGTALPPANGAGYTGTTRRKEFAQPTIHAYTDMEELLLLDPIHDVDEAGWPMPKPADAQDA
jgi:hypothetical protein